jgi:hypothetical protein
MKARANKYRSDKKVEGSVYYLDTDLYEEPKGYYILEIVRGFKLYHRINPTTIEYQIGDEWLSEEEIARRCKAK